MRIALVHQRHAAVGGTERFLNALAGHLIGLGHEVTIVCRRHGDPPHPEARFEVLHGFALGTSWRLWRFARDVERHVPDAGYDVVVGLGKTWTHDVVRAGGGCHQTYVEEAHRYAKRPWERWLGAGRLKNALAVAAERRAYAPGAYRRVIAISEMVKRDLMARHHVPEPAIRVIHNGVDLDRFHPRQRSSLGAELRSSLGWSADDLVLLFLGRGFGRKGLDRVLQALARLRSEAARLRLMVVGRDRGRPAYERMARSLGVAERVRFLGERGDPEVCYAAADLYVLAARYDAFAFSVLEALAVGLPVVTTDRTGAAELLGPDTGTVVDARGDAEELAGALAGWLDRERLDEARRATRALAERHSFEQTLRLTTEAIMEAAAERR